MKNAYFAGGCFWCITPIFRDLDGVTDVVSGYSGGDEENPTYLDVKKQKTGHRETIKVTYDEEKTGFHELLEIYLKSIDPFDTEGQFIDKGFSYTTAIFYTDENEKEISEKMCTALSEKSGKKVAVKVEPFKNFYDAEEYHQNWDLKNPEAFEKEIEESGRKGIIYLN